MTHAGATREQWLHAAIDAFRPRFAEVGMPIPEQIHISVGFGYGAKRESAVILGQCWSTAASEDGVNHIFISPEMNDTAKVLAALLHELIHAADDNKSGHKGAFAEAATRLGFQGKLTTLDPSIELSVEMMTLAATLGHYPHGALHPMGVPVKTPVGPDGSTIPVAIGRTHSGPSKQGTRMIKCECECGYSVRTTAKWLTVGNPFCPLGHEMFPLI